MKTSASILFFVTAMSMILLNCGDAATSSSNEETKEPTEKEHNTLTDEEVDEGWELLFDGETTNGWHTYGQDTIGDAWKIVDGALYLDVTEKEDWQAMGGGDIVTDEVYENFHLKLEWKISENGNSGIMFLVHEDPENYQYPWQTGPEMQILDNNGHPDAKIVTHRAGDLYDLIASTEETVKAVGEWNQAAIIVENNHLDFYLNGTNIVSVPLWGETWKSLISNSKFSEMSGFGTFKQGRISLQDHGDDVWFRNIKIRSLNP